ncbi:uncharacterized protein [Coffea arabica]|uniref:Reverse transcriptase domain-containing protein n=1 Tax=Coffea arabica TaxID=13443 RepID=A0A6P6U6V4_COFAR
MGDLNDIKSNGEKWGGRIRPASSFESFTGFINRTGLIDLGFEGVPWTWCNNRDNEGEIKERIDRVLGTKQWCGNFGKAKVIHAETEASDHCALVLDLTPVEIPRKRRFAFDKRWIMQEGVGEVIREAWGKEHQGSRLYRVQSKIKQVRMNLLHWSKNLNLNSKKQIEQIKKEIKEVRDRQCSEDRTKIVGLKRKLVEAYKREEIYWSQKARVKWLQEGDKNTSFFHASVMSRRKQNRINGLKRRSGEWCRNEGEIGEEIVDYFQQLFTTDSPTDFSAILEEIPQSITADMNRKLTRPVSDQEISHAVNSMHPNKAPGPDAFVPGRQILDNVLVAHESIHFLNNKRTGKDGYMAIKLDMSKAYDRVEWVFLAKMMQRMGFCPVWIQWILECITSVSYSVNVNGEKRGFIKPARGLRQGDPLSPYLFLICAEGFSALLRRANRQGRMSGMKIANAAPSLSHLFFADDSLIFCKAKVGEAVQLMQVLEEYGRASGQLINKEKSSIFFSKNVKGRRKEEVLKELEGMREVHQSKYLGLPMVIGRSKRQVFEFIRQKAIKRIGGWKEKLLSQAGNETLLKSVILALPAYVMSCCRLPKALCQNVCSEMARFWWGQREDEKKVHWIGWSRMTDIKAKGGLGFRDLQDFNLALLGKQLWRILMQPNLLMSRVMKARYFGGKSIWDTLPKGSDSWCWKSLLSARGVLEEGLRRRVGDGESIKIWEDRWLPGVEDGRIRSPRKADSKIQRVSELIKEGKWDRELLRQEFEEMDRLQILKIPLSLGKVMDRTYWAKSSSGLYSVKTGYKLIKEMKQSQCQHKGTPDPSSSRRIKSHNWSFLWGLSMPNKLKHFIWKCLQGILPTNAVVKGKCGKGDHVCKCCGDSSETLEHMFFLCCNARAIWKVAPVRWDGLEEFRNSFWHWWEELRGAVSREGGREHITLTVHILWQIWKARNNKQFNNSSREPIVVVNKALMEWNEFQLAQGGGTKHDFLTVGEQVKDRRWVAPQAGWIKINTDAALDQKHNRGGWGVVARNSSGELVGAWARPTEGCAEAQVEEALAIREAMVIAKQMGWRKVELESDCKLVVDRINARKEEVSIATIQLDIWRIMKDFDKCCCSFTRRNNNYVSHYLAKFAITLIDVAEWKFSFPAWLLELAQADLQEQLL